MRILKSSVLAAAVLAVAFSGCAEKKACTTAVAPVKAVKVVESVKVDTRDAEIKNLQAELAAARAKSAKVVTVTKEVTGPNELYPPNAQTGKCCARVLNPAKYEIKTEKVLVKEASERLVKIPAVYVTEREKILVKPAYTTWKKGSGPNQRVDNATGEIMCLVEIPAEYRTITRKVIKTPASVKSVPVPAVYKTVTRKVVATPAATKSVPVPAVYKTVKTKIVKTSASTKRIPIPATYQTVSKRIKISDAVLRWQEVKCKTTK